jgi:hypothetical protein
VWPVGLISTQEIDDQQSIYVLWGFRRVVAVLSVDDDGAINDWKKAMFSADFGVIVMLMML